MVGPNFVCVGHDPPRWLVRSLVPTAQVAVDALAERDHYREALERIRDGGYRGASFVAEEALRGNA